MDTIRIEDIWALCSDQTIFMTQHAHDRCRERGIKYKDLKSTILTGEIIEQYPTDTPYPSCLLLGVTVNHKPLHLVCSIGTGILWIITAYFPNSEKWDNNFKTRKEL
ncbi:MULTISPECIES: DUF4258 domain-containing protein [Caproicibacterium]|uniref:DUF4258 domain-containing protein n=1 Tax=Caproicibacterium argilliputei TaxID=3030016 RepID=A0AA97D9T5_9FIRM|nr:DUF4258 domain-containing protein [Caproicibacterium argilliputei]WOC31658.1 DUF4258 domain-containing protein [Caproicibacterium argilliputei]